MINRLCIVGVGLIGGSLARGLRSAGVCDSIVGCGRGEANLQKAVELGVIDSFETDVSNAVDGADMVVLSVPLGSMEGVMQAMSESLGATAVVTDVGSAKASVVTVAQRYLGDHISQFVPGHPIAGTENSGVDASFDGLFADRRVILTPTVQTDAAATDRVRSMWKACGATVSEMSVEHHDSVLAATSHLPHMLAFALVDYLASRDDKEEIFDYAAGGFRDFTRIASSDPVMWRDICISNSDAILSMVKEYQGALDSLSEALEASDGERILDLFQRAKTSRDQFSG